MHIILKTFVEQDTKSVSEAFDKELFIKLKPPGIGLEILRFDGCQKGDRVELSLNFGLFKQQWNSTIIDSGASEEEIYFVDQSTGKDLPFFLKHWTHRHRLIKEGSGTTIVDDIEFTSPYFTSILFYPIIWAQMAFRKPIYRKSFRKKKEDRI
jgi:ligand-binding SRPBCC domain-containing protein